MKQSVMKTTEIEYIDITLSEHRENKRATKGCHIKESKHLCELQTCVVCRQNNSECRLMYFTLSHLFFLITFWFSFCIFQTFYCVRQDLDDRYYCKTLKCAYFILLFVSTNHRNQLCPHHSILVSLKCIVLKLPSPHQTSF